MSTIALSLLKTASLFEGSCFIGSLAAGITPQQRAQVSAYGRIIWGLPFKSLMTRLDFVAPEATFGKPVNNDLKEGKVTLARDYGMWPQAPPEDEVALIDAYLQDPDVSDADYPGHYRYPQSNVARCRPRWRRPRCKCELAKAQLAMGFRHRRRWIRCSMLADYVTTRNV